MNEKYDIQTYVENVLNQLERELICRYEYFLRNSPNISLYRDTEKINIFKKLIQPTLMYYTKTIETLPIPIKIKKS